MVKIRDSNHGLYYPDVVLSIKNCEIGYFYIRNSDLGDVSTICLSLSHHFVVGRLVRFLVEGGRKKPVNLVTFVIWEIFDRWIGHDL